MKRATNGWHQGIQRNVYEDLMMELLAYLAL